MKRSGRSSATCDAAAFAFSAKVVSRRGGARSLAKHYSAASVDAAAHCHFGLWLAVLLGTLERLSVGLGWTPLGFEENLHGFESVSLAPR